MKSIKKMYYAIQRGDRTREKIETQNYGDAKDLLIAAQQQAEDIAITAESNSGGERSNAAAVHASPSKRRRAKHCRRCSQAVCRRSNVTRASR